MNPFETNRLYRLIRTRLVREGFGSGGGGGSATWPVSGTPSTFPPSAHTHAIGDVTGLQSALDGKQAAGSYAAAAHGHVIADVTGLQAALPRSGVATVTVPNGRIEWTETVTATGLTPGQRVVASIGTHEDADENGPEFLDVVALSARAGADSLTVTLAFGQPVAGAIKVEWVAHG